MTDIDLDAMRRARWDKRGQTRQVTLGGEVFVLPMELPLETGVAMTEVAQDMSPVARTLIRPQDWDRFMAVQPPPSNEDVVELLITYGTQLGEFAASRFSSGGTGEPSRPTSPTLTDLTSASAAGGDGAAPLAS